jgi:hypothetical protein
MSTSLVTRALLVVATLASAPSTSRTSPVREREDREEREHRERGRSHSPIADDPRARARALLELWGPEHPAARSYIETVKAREARIWAHLLPGASSLGANAWVSLGPADAFEEFNDGPIDGVDSGRPTAIVVDPRNPNVVYVALSGGGLWKTYDFVSASPDPHWIPVGEQLGALAIGALAIDPSNPEVLYAALGDAFDQSGNGILKSTDGGATWSGPVLLPGRPEPGSARDIKVDPSDARRVLVATDVGLYISRDGGSTFNLATAGLPSGGGAFWTIVQTGPTSWMTSGGTSGGNGFAGDLYYSSDSGESWTDLLATQKLPATAPTAGRISLAAGSPGRRGGAVVYAYVANTDGSTMLGFWRSFDGGRTWSEMPGTLANPTSDSECADLNFGHDQSWYNQAIAVDPSDDNRVIVGGNLCGARTLSGTAPQPVWENVSIWLDFQGNGVASGALPYVHADWHVATVVVAGGVVRVIAGTDGGIFSSTNVFSRRAIPGDQAAMPVVWKGHNKGLVTHLAYTVGSGDPTTGNPEVVLMGLQDNGTRIRLPGSPTVFNMVVGGDGLGTAVGKGTAGEFYWASVVTSGPGAYQVCRASVADCTHGGAAWQANDPPVQSSEFAQFDIRYSRIPTDPTGTGFLTNTTDRVWRTDTQLNWQPISSHFDPLVVRQLQASATIPRLDGAVLSGGHIAVTSDETSWTTSVPMGALGEVVFHASSVDFPPTTPTTPALVTPGDVYVASSAAQMTRAGNVFITHDRGRTFEPLHGSGRGELPNVPIFSVRYDPADALNKSIYVGTDLGVYRTRDGGTTWERFGAGLPLVRVTDLSFAVNGSLLRIATYGRGVWEIYPSSQAWRGVSGDGDFDRNLVLDYRDLGALASRLGTDPSTPGWPTYSWISDLAPGAATPPRAAIDDEDLNTFLTAFGGHP